MLGSTLVAALVFALAMFFALWIVSVAVRDASIVDMFWGTGFVLVTGFAAVHAGAGGARSRLLLILVTFWGLRLTVHLLRRNLGKGEDHRYRAMREAHGSRFWLVSLGTVYLLQGSILWVVSLPLLHAQMTSRQHLGGLAAVGGALFAIGFLFESVGDLQLARFKADPANEGATLQAGLWRYTRHPNYFGDALVWWGLFLMALTPGALWTVMSPALMTFLLVRVSGVRLLEKTLKTTKPDYQDYVRRTSAFFPWPPRPQ